MATKVSHSKRMAGSVVVQVEDDINNIDPTSICRSVRVTGFKAETKSEDLIIHFQRTKNGGGDIERIIVSKKGTAVITFDDPKVVSSVVMHKHNFEGVVLTVERYLDTIVKNGQQLEVFEVVSAELCLEFVEHLSREQTKALLDEIKKKTHVNWIESSETFLLSGTFKQLEESRAYLQQGVKQSNGIVVFNDLRRKGAPFQGHENESTPRYDEAENQEDVDQIRPATAAENEVTHPPERISDETNDDDRKVSSTSFEIQSFEIEPKIVKVFVKAHDKELKEIETNYHVEIPRQAEGNKLCLKPKDECSADDYEEACNKFISLYQKMYQLIKMQRFSLKSETKIVTARGAISKISKTFPISVERNKDQSWELYGEANHIDEALKYLEEEGVGINMEKEDTVDERGRRKQWKDDEEAMDVDPPEHSIGDNNPGNRLETFLDLPAGKLKVSVYKGDITKERVDVIVNAANGELQHVGGVAKAILDKGGKKIREESSAIIKKRGVLKDGDAVNTTSGKLHCKAVVHAVGPVWKDVGPKKSKIVLRRACLNSFIETEKLNMTSIALPAIGSGIYGMPKDVCAEVMFDAVDEFVRQGPKKKKITDIRFVNIDEPSVQAFTKEFNNRYDDRGGSSSGKASEGGTSRFSPTGVEGGGSTVPTSRSNRGRGKTRDKPHTANPNGVGVNQYDGSFFGSSAANNDHPLNPAGHSVSSNASYSNAVKGNTAGRDPRPPIDRHPQGHKEKGGFSLPSKGDDGVTTDKKEEDTCPICLDPISSPRSLKCKHVFCSVCLQTALNMCNKCPVCQEPQGVLQGNQPRGDMRFRTERYSSLPGYGGCGTIIIDYHFPSGKQGPEHPNPGQYYQGTSRTAYLPDNREGREVLQLLRRAFDARLVFTVGTSITTGYSNQVIWNDIHHKTNVYGGSPGFGYPDPDYLRRVKEELAAKGIR